MAQVLFSFPSELLLIFISSTLQVGLNVCYPFLVQEAVTFLDSPTAPVNVGYGLLGGFFCVSFGIAVSRVRFMRCDHLLT
jgi:ATP-binding cassette subfamily C (CFTR/MRP) protein 1